MPVAFFTDALAIHAAMKQAAGEGNPSAAHMKAAALALVHNT